MPPFSCRESRRHPQTQSGHYAPREDGRIGREVSFRLQVHVENSVFHFSYLCYIVPEGMLQSRFLRRGLDGTVEAVLQIVAGYTPKAGHHDSSSALRSPEEKLYRSGWRAERPHGPRKRPQCWVRQSGAQTRCREDVRLKRWFAKLSLDPKWGRAWLLELRV